MLRTMAREASTRGLGALYATYGAFMLKSIPFDVAELATYSQMTDWREAAAARAAGGGGGGDTWRGRVGEALAAMPLSASDMLIGARGGEGSWAGGAAVEWLQAAGRCCRQGQTALHLLCPAASAHPRLTHCTCTTTHDSHQTGAAAGVATALVSMPCILYPCSPSCPARLPPAGAAAGVASVLVSMPCDVIKTRMDLHPPHCPPGGASGALCSTKAFFETGRQLVAAGGGLHALFVGVAPRLLQVRLVVGGVGWFGVGLG